MKKVYSIVILFVILILVSNSVFATEYWDKENKKRETVFKDALDSYMETFMKEETPTEDKITNYEYSGFGIAAKGETEDKLYVNISVNVTPINENNTTWNKSSNCCFATFSKVNGEYILEKISRYPDNYNKFLERFEEYEKNNPETSESVQIQGQEIANNLANQKIEKMTNIIVIVCSIILLVTICVIVKRIVR